MSHAKLTSTHCALTCAVLIISSHMLQYQCWRRTRICIDPSEHSFASRDPILSHIQDILQYSPRSFPLKIQEDSRNLHLPPIIMVQWKRAPKRRFLKAIFRFRVLLGCYYKGLYYPSTQLQAIITILTWILQGVQRIFATPQGSVPKTPCWRVLV